jgi:hypothetical protein
MAGIILLVAVFRSGIIGHPVAILSDEHIRRGAGSLLRLIPAVTAFNFILFSSPLPMRENSGGLFTTILGLVFLYGAIRWFLAKDELDARPFWVITITSLVLVAAIQGANFAIISFSALFLSIGGLLFLSSPRGNWEKWVVLFSLMAFLLAPFSTSSPIRAIISVSGWTNVFLIPGYGLLLIGAIRHIFRKDKLTISKDNWMRLFQVSGLVMLSISSWVTGALILDQIQSTENWWISLVILSLVLTGSILLYRIGAFQENVIQTVFGKFRNHDETDIKKRPSSVFMIFPVWLFKTISDLLRLVQNVLEGDGGIIWSLLFLAILASLVLSGGAP